MKRSIVLVCSFLMFGLVMIGWAADQASKDPVKLSPDVYKVLFENDQVRVLDIHMDKGGKSPMHSHPGSYIYNFTPGKVRFTSTDGKSEEVDLKAASSMWRDAESHAVENIGETEVRVLHVEIKHATGDKGAQLAGAKTSGEHVMVSPQDLKWQAGPPSLPQGVQVVMLEGDLNQSGPFTLRAKMPANYIIPPHHHPGDEHLTVISGALHMGMGEKLDQSKGHEIAAGGFGIMPAGMRHYAWTKGETVIQVHGIGPWGINYVNPADDPRNKK